MKKLKKVLIVDTDQKFIKNLENFFSSYGIETVIAQDGNKALEIANESFDAVISEIVIPKIDGLKLSKTLYTKFGSNLPIIIVSGIYKGSSIKNKALKVNKASVFLEKPFTLETFKKAITEDLNFVLEINEEDDEGKTQIFEKDEMDKMIGKEISEEDKKLLSSNELFGDILNDINKQVEEDIEKANEKQDKTETILEELEEIEEIEEIREIEEKPEEKSLKQKEEILKDKKEEQKLKQSQKHTHHHKIEDTLDIDKLITDIVKPKEKPKEKIVSEHKKELKEKTKRNIETDDIDKLIRKTLVELKKKEKIKEKEKKVEGKKETSIHDNKTQQFDEQKVKELEQKKAEIEKNIEKIEGRYELLNKIATGGMAEIYKAKQKGPSGFEKIVTIKKILPHLAQDEDFITMFIDEARIAASLSHPNIVQIFDLGKMNNQYIIAMEYVSGKDLGAVLKNLRKLKKSLPTDIALYIALKISDALDYAHRKKDSNGVPLKIVHRDVNPNNILISYEGEIKLTDFGISKARIKLHQTIAGGLKGKLIYMSPEQASGKEDVDNRSDIFAIGVLLYEMLTLRNPFIATSETAILEKVRNVRYEPPNLFNKNISTNTLNIIKKCLMKNPEDRFQSARELRNEIEKELVKEVSNIAIMKDILAKFMARLFPEEVEKEGFSIEDTREIMKKKMEIDKIIKKKEFKEAKEKTKEAEEIKEEEAIVKAKNIEEIKKEAPEIKKEKEIHKTEPVKKDKRTKEEILEEMEEILKEEKSSSKTFFIIIIILVLLGGAGYFFYTNYLSVKEFPQNYTSKNNLTVNQSKIAIPENTQENNLNQQNSDQIDNQTINQTTTQTSPINTQDQVKNNQNQQTNTPPLQKTNTNNTNTQNTNSKTNQKITTQTQNKKKSTPQTNRGANKNRTQKINNNSTVQKNIKNQATNTQTKTTPSTTVTTNNNKDTTNKTNSEQTPQKQTSETKTQNLNTPENQSPKPQPQNVPAFREGDVVPISTLDSPIKILKKAIPTLTYEEARLGNVRVIINMLVGVDGSVEKFRVIRTIPPIPGMDKKISDVIKGWKFSIPKREGKKVRVWKIVSLLIKK